MHVYIYINYTRCANGKQSRNVYDCTGWDQHQSISVYKTLLAYRQVLSCRVCSNNPFDVDPHHSARLVQTRSMVCSALTGRKLRAGAVEHQDSNKRRQLAGVSACWFHDQSKPVTMCQMTKQNNIRFATTVHRQDLNACTYNLYCWIMDEIADGSTCM